MGRSPARKLLKKADITICTMSVVAACTLLASCSTPPTPPTVDESTRRPLNNRNALDLQTCKADLSRAHASLAETQLFARTPSTPEAGPAPTKPKPAICDQPAPTAQANHTIIIPFPTNSARLSLRPDDAEALVLKAANAAFIVIRGRTDAAHESLHDSKLARQRADAAASFLIERGTPASRLRVSWQGFGDGMVSAAAQNRRVELEFYAVRPTSVLLQSDIATK